MGGQHKRVQRLSVVPYTSKRLHRVMVVVVVIGYFFAAAAGYWWGYDKHRLKLARKEDSILRLTKKNQTLSDSVKALRAEVIKNQQALALEQQTIELIRQENLDLQSRVNALELEVAFFDRVVKTTKDAQGLAFGRLGINPVDDNEYEISVDIMQISGRKRLKGKLYIEIEGVDDQGEKQLLNLPISENNSSGPALNLSFVSYQTVQFAFSIPEKFEPKVLTLTAKIEKGKRVELKKRFQWIAQ